MEKRTMNRRYFGLSVPTWAATFVLLALVGTLSLTMGTRESAVAQAPAVAAGSETGGGTSYAKSLSKAFREAAQKVLPAVVMIKNLPADKEPVEGRAESPEGPSEENPFGDMLPPEFRRFFKDMPQMPRHGFPHGEVSGVGSGVIIDPSGIILTNNHVVDGGGKVVVRLHDGREFTATEVKADPKSDLAVLRIKDAGKLAAVKLGNSDDAQVGDWVLALGDPFGLEGTVTAGIISAKGRGLGIAPRENFIQTDAAINPGNSGGPLVNLDGEIVGINTAIHSQSGGNQGVGFAVSANLAKWVSQQLIAHGSVRRAYLGVAIQPVSQELAKQFGVQARQGVVISDVQPNTPAAAAGLKAGDVVIDFAGKPVASPQELQQAVEQASIGGKQALTIMRDGKRMTLDVTAREQPADYGLARSESMSPGKSGSVGEKTLGIDVSNLTADVAEKLGIKAGEGVVITDVRVGGPASRAGLSPGMVIARVGQKPVKSVDEFHKAMEKESLAKGVMLLVRSGQGTQFVVIQSSQ
jgi:serine protease Do